MPCQLLFWLKSNGGSGAELKEKFSEIRAKKLIFLWNIVSITVKKILRGRERSPREKSFEICKKFTKAKKENKGPLGSYSHNMGNSKRRFSCIFKRCDKIDDVIFDST